MEIIELEWGMQLLIHGSSGETRYPTLAEGVSRGRYLLADYTHKDFGYDLKAWHDYLAAEYQDEYRQGAVPGEYPDEILKAIDDPRWNATVVVANAEYPMEEISRLMTLYWAAIGKANNVWAGRQRSCPKCQTVFKSVQNRGQCPNCAKMFYASHPEGKGDDQWWRKEPYCSEF